jgi:hypothetical protein
VKWTPGANTAIDATVNPDFSQIESDVAQINTNERFALFFPEKRPFFLEGIELFSTPIQAVYTRTITDPLWGLRGTGKLGAFSYTGFVTQDQGGGSVILPGQTPRTWPTRTSAPGWGWVACGASSGAAPSPASWPRTARSREAASIASSAPTSSGVPPRTTPSPGSSYFRGR